MSIYELGIGAIWGKGKKYYFVRYFEEKYGVSERKSHKK